MTMDLILNNPTLKRAHEPERVAKRREQLSRVLDEMKQGYMNDCQLDPQGASTPNYAAIRLHWGTKWAEQSRTAQNASEPVEVAGVDALFEWIDGYRKEEERRAGALRPLHQVKDLTPYGFALVKPGSARGDLYLSSHALLGITAGGMVHVWLREPGDIQETWICQCGMVEHRNPHIELIDYTIGELFKVLAGMRITSVALPTSMEVDRARQYLEQQ